MKNPNICRYIMYGLILSGMAISGVSACVYGVDPIPLVFIIGAIIAFAGIAFGFAFVRCPHCGRQLNFKGFKTEYCPHCGEKIE